MRITNRKNDTKRKEFESVISRITVLCSTYKQECDSIFCKDIVSQIEPILRQLKETTHFNHYCVELNDNRSLEVEADTIEELLDILKKNDIEAASIKSLEKGY